MTGLRLARNLSHWSRGCYSLGKNCYVYNFGSLQPGMWSTSPFTPGCFAIASGSSIKFDGIPEGRTCKGKPGVGTSYAAEERCKSAQKVRQQEAGLEAEQRGLELELYYGKRMLQAAVASPPHHTAGTNGLTLKYG